jgi:diphosphoinositol-polyphosphate diphosphatase
MEEDMKLEKQDNNDDPPSVLVTDVSECQSMSPNCYKRSSNMQHHSDLLQRASQEIAIHFGY